MPFGTMKTEYTEQNIYITIRIHKHNNKIVSITIKIINITIKMLRPYLQ